jgi:hypothetical protein
MTELKICNAYVYGTMDIMLRLVCAACMYAYQFVCIPILFKSRNCIQIYKLNAKSKCCFYSKISTSFQWYACFGKSNNIKYSKMDKTIHGNCACI